MRVAIVSTPIERCHQIGKALGLDYVAISSRNGTGGGRGMQFDAMLIDASVGAVSPRRWEELAPTVMDKPVFAFHEWREWIG